MRNTEETAWLSSHCCVLTPPHISTSNPWQILFSPLGSKGISLVKNQIRVGDTAQSEQMPSMSEAPISIPNTLNQKNQITQSPLLHTPGDPEAITTGFWTWIHRQARMTEHWDALVGESNSRLPYDHPDPRVTLWQTYILPGIIVTMHATDL